MLLLWLPGRTLLRKYFAKQSAAVKGYETAYQACQQYFHFYDFFQIPKVVCGQYWRRVDRDRRLCVASGGCIRLVTRPSSSAARRPLHVSPNSSTLSQRIRNHSNFVPLHIYMKVLSCSILAAPVKRNATIILLSGRERRK